MITGKLKDGYGIIQRDIMTMDINPYSKNVYCLLVSYTGKENTCFPSLKTISENLKISKTTVIKSIKELTQHNLILVTKSKSVQANYDNNIYEPLFILDGGGSTCGELPLVHQVVTKNSTITSKQQKEEKKDFQTRVNDFKQSLYPFVVGDKNPTGFEKELVKEFFEYWAEPNTGATEFRREGEKFFDIKRRLNTFKKISATHKVEFKTKNATANDITN